MRINESVIEDIIDNIMNMNLFDFEVISSEISTPIIINENEEIEVPVKIKMKKKAIIEDDRRRLASITEKEKQIETCLGI